MRSELLGEINEVRKDELKRKKWKEKERLFLHATCESVWIITYRVPYWWIIIIVPRKIESCTIRTEMKHCCARATNIHVLNERTYSNTKHLQRSDKR